MSDHIALCKLTGWDCCLPNGLTKAALHDQSTRGCAALQTKDQDNELLVRKLKERFERCGFQIMTWTIDAAWNSEIPTAKEAPVASLTSNSLQSSRGSESVRDVWWLAGWA